MAKKKKYNKTIIADRENIRLSKELEKGKSRLDKKLNITLGVVIALLFISFLLLPALSMNFSGSLKDYLGDLVTDENNKTIDITTNMSFIDILFAMTGGYENSVDYIIKNNSSDITADVLKVAFNSKVTPQEIEQFDTAYIASFVIAILLFISMVLLLTVTAVKRSKNKGGVLLFISILLTDIFAFIQWILFIAVGISASGKGYIQPHIASYLIFAGSIALSVVYAIYLVKVKKINAQKKQLADALSDKGGES